MMKYKVERYNMIDNVWVYMNAFQTYTEASEAASEYERRYRGTYRVTALSGK